MGGEGKILIYYISYSTIIIIIIIYQSATVASAISMWHIKVITKLLNTT
mgnify:CR=1 FL=1